MDSKEFASRLNSSLSPSRAIRTPEMLKGREAKLKSVLREIDVPGRQIFIYGLRGVGKTSLALTCALKARPEQIIVPTIICTIGDNFFSIVRDIAEQILPSDPRTIKSGYKAGATAKIGSFGGAVEAYTEKGKVPLPSSLNDALGLLEFCATTLSYEPVIVIDEFENVRDEETAPLFASMVKGIADRRIPIKFIFCGIAESVSDVFVSHGSAHRYFHTEELDRLGWEARFSIIDEGSKAAGLQIDYNTKIRIASISDGFPYFVHELASKVLWTMFDRGYQSGLVSRAEDFLEAAQRAVEGIELEFKKHYDKAVEKYKTDGEIILWALADGHEFRRNLDKIYQSYWRISMELELKPLPKNRMTPRLHKFREEAFSSIVVSDRRSWFEFSQKMMRGYARLRASRSSVHLDPDHPLGVTGRPL